MDKLAVDGSKIHGPARQITYRAVCYDPSKIELIMVNLRNESPAVDMLQDSGVPTISLHRHKLDPRTLKDLMGLIHEYRPDVLHLAGYGAWTFGRLASRLKGVPCVLQEHFIDDHVPLYQQLADWLLSGIEKRVLAVSDGVCDFCIHKRYIRTPVQVVCNGVPLEGMVPPTAADKARARQELRISKEKKIVVIVGRLAEMKGHRFLIEALALLTPKFKDITLMIVGAGPMQGTLEQLVQKQGLTENVVFIGYKHDVMPYLRAADVSVISSIYGEGFPGVAVETFLANTPLVITDLPNYRGQFFKDNVNCLLVEPGNHSAMAEALFQVLSNNYFGKALSHGAWQSLRTCDIKIISQKYVELYFDIVGTYNN